MSQINTKKYEGIIGAVYIDNRENNRVDYAMREYSSLNPLVSQLDIGDYIFRSSIPKAVTMSVTGTTIEYDYVVFEYKTEQDFISSIIGESHHLANQVYQMITHFDYHFIIVETEDLREALQKHYYQTGIDVSLAQIDGAIADFCTNSTLLFVQTQYQAFDLMMRIAGHMFLNKPVRYKYGKKSTNVALNYLSAMKGLDKLAENIVRTLDLHSVKDLFELTKEDLMTVDKVGSKTADKILKHIRG